MHHRKGRWPIQTRRGQMLAVVVGDRRRRLRHHEPVVRRLRDRWRRCLPQRGAPRSPGPAATERRGRGIVICVGLRVFTAVVPAGRRTGTGRCGQRRAWWAAPWARLRLRWRGGPLGGCSPACSATIEHRQLQLLDGMVMHWRRQGVTRDHRRCHHHRGESAMGRQFVLPEGVDVEVHLMWHRRLVVRRLVALGQGHLLLPVCIVGPQRSGRHW
mmetsp:Transcript_2913/g.7906  ORF Transcript_2913/g.7906 Transcript_2913/m.7906 type:complete len:214 (+) Transcript_2913:196-837(+)